MSPEDEHSAAPVTSAETTRRQHLRDRSTKAYLRVEDKAPPSVGSRMRAFRERIRARRTLDTAWRVMVFALGVTLLVAGAIMFVIPGPGFATIILALVILGSEFTWATRALHPVKEAASKAADAALDPKRRKRNIIIGAIVGILIGAVVCWYLLTYGFTLAPIMDLVHVVI